MGRVLSSSPFRIHSFSENFFFRRRYPPALGGVQGPGLGGYGVGAKRGKESRTGGGTLMGRDGAIPPSPNPSENFFRIFFFFLR